MQYARIALALALAVCFAHGQDDLRVEIDPATGEVKPSQYKLMYFKSRGRAEVIRTVFAHAGVPYEDVRFDNTGDRADFNAERDRGTFPFRQVPVLEVDGQILAQSHAIERFLARRFRLMGETELEVVQVDSVCEHIADIYNKHSSIKYDKSIDEAERATRFNAFFGEYLPPKLQMLEAIATANVHKDDPTLPSWLVGSEVSLADISLHVLLDAYGDKVSTATLESVPTVGTIHQAVAKLPGVAKWEQARPPA